MSGDIRATVSVHNPDANEIGITRGQPGELNQDSLYLDIARTVYIAVGTPVSALADDVAALRKLAEVAAELAAELEARAVTS